MPSRAASAAWESISPRSLVPAQDFIRSTAGSRASTMVLSPTCALPRSLIWARLPSKSSIRAAPSRLLRSGFPLAPPMNMVPKITPEAPPMLMSMVLPISWNRA